MLHQTFPAIPPFETGRQIVSRLAFLVRPKDKLTVSAWAERHLTYYDPLALPFLPEIMDACGDPVTSEVGDMGPAQGGKSMVGEAFIGWSIEQEPEPFMVTQPDKLAMETFVKLRINAMIGSTPALKAQLAPVGNADNMYIKQFRGMALMASWPVENHFRQRSVCRGWLDDYDGFPTNSEGQVDIEGKGDGISQLDGRMTAFKGRDTKLVSSSPALGEKAGIEPFIVGGTDERLWPVCPQCLERFEIDLIRDLKFDAGTPEEAALSAHVVCPANGCILQPSARHQLLSSLIDLPNRGFIAARPEAGKYRRTFRRDGLLAFTPWPELARGWRAAQIAWEARQDEAPLRVFFNTKAGKNYRSKLSGDKPIASAELANRRGCFKLGTVPRGVMAINILIDTQHDRFEGGAVGYGPNGERWLIDRFSIDVLDDGLTQVAPLTHHEHWKALLPLFDRKYPMVEADGTVIGHAPVLSITVDTGGSDKKGDQATAGAKWFWNAARGMGVHPSRITLIKGGSNPKGELMPRGKFADQKMKGGAKRNSAQLWIPNVHSIKNIIDAKLRRASPGPGYVHLPADLRMEHVDELTAEEMKAGKWEKLRPRNETWDILVYGEAAILRPPFAQSRSDMRWVPRDFRISWPAQGSIDLATPSVAQAVQPDPAAAEVITPPPPPAPRRRAAPRDSWFQSAAGGDSWL